MKKLFLISLFLLLPTGIFACEDMYASREAFCYYKYDEPCECNSTPCWYVHNWERGEWYTQQGLSCRACATVKSKYWMKNEGWGWVKGRCQEPSSPMDYSAPVPTPPEPELFFNNQMADEIARLINEERQALGLPLLMLVPKLRTSSVYKIEDMDANQYFSHDGLVSFLNRADYKYQSAGEILFRDIHVGNLTPFLIVNAWMHSADHRQAIVGSYTEFNCAYAYPYAACHFGTPRVIPEPEPEPQLPPVNEPCPQEEQRIILLNQIKQLLTQLIGLLTQLSLL